MVGHELSVTCVAVSPDGKWIASGSADRTVRIWDRAGGGNRTVLEGHTDAVSAVAFSPDGRRLISGSRDGSVRLWDAKSGAELRKLETKGAVHDLAIDRSGKLLASGGSGKAVHIWNLESAKLVRTLEGHRGEVYAVDFSPDGARVVSGGKDRTVRVWETETGVCTLRFLSRSGWVTSVAFSDDGSQLLACGLGVGAGVQVWDAGQSTRPLAWDSVVPVTEAVKPVPVVGAPAKADPNSTAVAVIVNEANPLHGMSFADLRRYAKMTKQLWSDRQRVDLFLPNTRSPAYRTLLTRVFKTSHKKLQKTWVRKLFSGDIPAKPSTLSSSAAAGNLVRKRPGALAFVSASAIPKGVRVLKIDGKLPGEAGYPLAEGD